MFFKKCQKLFQQALQNCPMSIKCCPKFAKAVFSWKMKYFDTFRKTAQKVFKNCPDG